MHRIRKSLAVLATTLAAGGTCFQLGGCDPLGAIGTTIGNLNPCAAGILACDPAQYAFANSGISGPGVRPDLDPFCTYPPFCSRTQDPIFGGLSLYGPP